jgi:hypothetical protein
VSGDDERFPMKTIGHDRQDAGPTVQSTTRRFAESEDVKEFADKAIAEKPI